VISLHGPTGPLVNKNFLASLMSITSEPFQRTDIVPGSTDPVNFYCFTYSNIERGKIATENRNMIEARSDYDLKADYRTS
jgi:hypothetical protein